MTIYGAASHDKVVKLTIFCSQCMSLMLFTIFAAKSPQVNSSTIMPEVDMKNEKTQTMPQSWSTESRRSVLMILLQKWQSDLMMTMTMIVNCMAQIYMKSKLRERLWDDIVITELHCERNVVTFCFTVVSVIILWYCSLIVSQLNGCVIHSFIIFIWYFKTVPRDNCWGKHGGTNIIYSPVYAYVSGQWPI